MKRLLTDAKVKNLKPKDKGYKTADGGGLYVYTTKAGTRSFRYDFKLNGKWGTVTFGTYPELSLAGAREGHEQARAKIAKGIDPRKDNNENDRLKSFSDYAKENVNTAQNAERTAKKKLQRMEKYLFSHLDKKPVTEINTIELLNLIKPIAQGGKIETARRLANDCKRVFNDLLALQIIVQNPAAMLIDLLPAQPEPVNLAHTTNPKDFAVLLKAFDCYQGDFAVKQALSLAPLVFLRPHNIRFLKWEYIDFQSRLITIPAEQMKMSRPHKVPLSEQALAIINKMQPLTGSKELVFIAGNRDKALSENTLNLAIQRAKNPLTGKALGKGFSTSHGLRHTASTLLNEMGFNPDVIELQLAHLDKDRMRRTYNKAELMPERIKMMQSWADYLDGLKNGADVLPIKKKRGA